MRNCFVTLMMAAVTSEAIAQVPRPAVEATTAERNQAREQRRAELRNVLQAGRLTEAAATPALDAPVLRQLSVSERAEIRRQLREYQAENQRSRP